MKYIIEFILRNRHKVIILIQILLVILGYTLAFLLRFDFLVSEQYISILIITLPLLLVSRLTTYFLFKLNSGWWRFVSMLDLVNITKAIALGSIFFLAGLVFFYDLEGFPRSVVIIEAIINFILIGGVRFAVRWFRETEAFDKPKHLKFILVVGAGKTAIQLLSEIRRNPQLGIQVVGFIDDDPIKMNEYIQGIKVIGNCDNIPNLVKKFNIDEIIITIPYAGFKKISSVVQISKECGIKAKVLPSFSELIDKDGLWQQLRDVPYNELLNRPLLEFRREDDIDLLKNEIWSKTVLVTGAGGSIGSELSRQSAKLKPKLLILYERNETSLYYLELELRKHNSECHILPVIGDIVDTRKFNDVINQHNVNLIYHAAAYKHVPMMEREPLEAVHNNILVTKAVARSALVNKVDKFIYISTDKAVNPSSIMGATKRIGEMVMQAYSGNATKFITVRFGNVIGSNGSVLPLFKKQIAQGGPVTITHPEASRYFMTISEAVQLVVTAGAIGKGGEIFLLDMGEPIIINDLANELIKSSGLIPGKDIEINFIGLRPGEKLHEELYWEGENIIPTKNKKITKLQTNGFDKEFILSQLDNLEKFDREKSSEGIIKILKHLLPEYTFNGQKEIINEYRLPEIQASVPAERILTSK